MTKETQFKFVFNPKWSKRDLKKEFGVDAISYINALYFFKTNSIEVNLTCLQYSEIQSERELIQYISKTIIHEYTHSAIREILGTNYIPSKEEDILTEMGL